MTGKPQAPARGRPSIAVLALVVGLGVVMAGFALRAGDVPAGEAGIVIAPPETNVAQPMPEVPNADPEPVLTQVTMDGARSSATFQLADGSIRVVMLGQELRSGWRMKGLASGAATFATSGGDLRFALSGISVDTEQEGLADGAQPKSVLIPDAPAISADGSAVARCSDPEC